MKTVHNNINRLYFVYTFIFIFNNSVAFDTEPNGSSSSKEPKDSYESQTSNHEHVASCSYKIESNLSASLESSNSDISSEFSIDSNEIDSDVAPDDNVDSPGPNITELRNSNYKLRSSNDIGSQTDVEDSTELSKFKEDKTTQTDIKYIKSLKLALLKEPFDFNSSDEYIEDTLTSDQDDKYDIYPNNDTNLGFNKIAEYKYNLNTCETISLNEPNSEIFLGDIKKSGIIKWPIVYVDLSKYDISNDELNKVQIPSNGINYIGCDLNSLDTGNFNSHLKRTLSDLNGWVVIRPVINDGKHVIGNVIFGNIAVAINERIKSRIVSFTIHERQQIVKIEEFTSKCISRVIYFEQTKDTINNKYFSTKKYQRIAYDNWHNSSNQISFYTRTGITYHTLDFSCPQEYNNIFLVEVNGNETTYRPNYIMNRYISNVIFGNVKVLYEMDNIYRSVRCITDGNIKFIEIFTIDSLGRKNHLLYTNKNSISSDYDYTKVKYSRDGSIIYHELERLKEFYLTPVNLNIPKMIYKGEMWDVCKGITLCDCEQNYTDDIISYENLKFCGKCCGCKLDIYNNIPHNEHVDTESFIQYSYKDYKQFGSIYIYINPKLIYTHRLGKIRIGNAVFPLGSLGYIVSIKITKYKNDKVIIGFIILDGGKYEYIDYILQPDGESLKLITKYNVYGIKPRWLSIWDTKRSRLFVDLHLNKDVTALIKCEYMHENNEIYYYENEFVNISNVYWKHQLLSDRIVEDKKLIRRNVRVVIISNLRLVTIYSLYLTKCPQPRSKKIIINISKEYKYWNIDIQHFLQNSNDKFERISDEYANCKIRESDTVLKNLYIDFSENNIGMGDFFEVIEEPNSIYYKIKPEISSSVKIGDVKIGEMTFKQSGIYDIIGISIQNKVSFPFPIKNKCCSRKISIFINDGLKVMIIEYAEIKNDSGGVEYINMSPFPNINDSIMDVVSHALETYLKRIINLSSEEKMILAPDEMEFECLLLVKLEASKIYKKLAENFEDTILCNIICDFFELLVSEFIHEIYSLDEDEIVNVEVQRYIYNAEVNMRNNKLKSKTIT